MPGEDSGKRRGWGVGVRALPYECYLSPWAYAWRLPSGDMAYELRARADRRVYERMSNVLLDTLEDVRVCFLLPWRQVVPVRHVGWLRIWEMLKYLPNPTESYKASLL